MRTTLAVGLLTMLLGTTAAPSAEPPADLRYLPSNCQMVGVIHVEKLLASPAFKLLQKEVPAVAVRTPKAPTSLPLPLDAIDSVLFGGVATGATGEGVFVFRTRKPIKPGDVVWASNNVNRPAPVKVGKFTMYQRRGDSYCLAGENLLVVGEAKVLHAILEREKMPTLSKTLETALPDVDWSATVACVLDMRDIRGKRIGAPPFIPGLDLPAAEGLMEALIVSLKSDDEMNLAVTAIANDKAGAAALKGHVERFATFARKALENPEVNAPQEVVNLFKLATNIEGTRVTVTARLPAEPLARLLNILTK